MNNFMAIKCTNFMTKGNKPNNNKWLPIKFQAQINFIDEFPQTLKGDNNINIKSTYYVQKTLREYLFLLWLVVYVCMREPPWTWCSHFLS